MAFFEAFSGRHGEYGLAERVDVRGAMIERLQRPSVLARVVRPPADEPLTAARGRIGDSIQALAAGARTPFAALYRLVMYTSLITGFQAVARTLRCQYVLEIKPDPIVLAMIFALTVFVYGRDRLTGADADSAADGRTRWVVAHRHGLKAFVNACGLLGLVLTLFAPTTIPLLAVTLGLALVYTTPVLPGRRSLKSLPGVKTVFVAAIWTAVCVGLPVAAAHNGWGIRELLVAAVVFCLMSTIVSVNDLYDTRADRLNGIRSLAVLFGEGSVRVGGVAVSLAAALVAACSVGSPGLLLAALYHAAYAGSVRVDRGRDCWSNALVYRASSFVMLLLVVLVR